MKDMTKDITGARRLAEIDRLQARPDGGRRLADCDLVLTALMTVLCLIGLVMVLSASTVQSLHQFGTPWYYFERQGIYLCLGAVAFFVAQGIRISFWQRMARPLMLLAGAALLAVLFVGRSAGGASTWSM